MLWGIRNSVVGVWLDLSGGSHRLGRFYSFELVVSRLFFFIGRPMIWCLNQFDYLFLHSFDVPLKRVLLQRAENFCIEYLINYIARRWKGFVDCFVECYFVSRFSKSSGGDYREVKSVFFGVVVSVLCRGMGYCPPTSFVIIKISKLFFVLLVSFL